jgi:hypothetical protein
MPGFGTRLSPARFYGWVRSGSRVVFASVARDVPACGWHPQATRGPHSLVPDLATGKCVKPFHDLNDVNRGGPHSAAAAIIAKDGGRMDGFIIAEQVDTHGWPHLRFSRFWP